MMRSSQNRRKRRPQPTLRLPSKRDVSSFREKRLLAHLHEQLMIQIEQNPSDWQLHFQIANLLAFTDDSFNANKDIDIKHAETHYQTSLKLVQQLHEQDYIIYQNQNKIQFDSINTPTINTPISAFDIDIDTNPIDAMVLYEDEEEKCAQPLVPLVPLIALPLLSGGESFSRNYNKRKKSRGKSKKKRSMQSNKSYKSNKSDTDYTISTNTSQSHKKRRKRRSKQEREQRNKNNSNTNSNTIGSPKKRHGLQISIPIASSKQPQRIKKRSLLIAVYSDNDTVSKQISCKYSSAMSQEEISMELEKKHKNKTKNKKNKKRLNIAATYLSAVARLNQGKTHRKRPSIIMMFNPDSPQNNGGLSTSSPSLLSFGYSNTSPISLVQSEVETVNDTIDEYVVPAEINKGYTECFFGYGKYLCQNKRIKEGVHNLLDCASWYNDSFVDPSCLTSLVLPPQFLFQDSVKKRHCINFRTLTKYISKVLSDEQRCLDKQYKKMNVDKYIKEYDTYLAEFQEEMEKNIKIVINDAAAGANATNFNGISSGNISPVSSNGPPTLELYHTLSNGSLGHALVSDLRLQTYRSIESVQSDLSYQTLLSPDPLSPGAFSVMSGVSCVSTPYASDNERDKESNKNKVQLINYQVYPQIIQDVVSEYTHLCSYYHRLGLLLTDFLRYGDAKREYAKALKIFRKLKIKPQLYEDILSQIRMTQRNSIKSSHSHQERAQKIAQKHKHTASRSNIRAPLSPSFDFSFSARDQFLFKAK